MKNFRSCASVLLLGSAALSGFRAEAADYFCYLPGANGLTTHVRQTLTRQLLKEGLPFVAFDPGDIGTVQERTKVFMRAFSHLVQKDPDAKCHLFGYSMGGLISRYAYHHAKFQSEAGESAFKDRVLSLTTAATPHLGTPLAKILRRYWEAAAPGVEQLSEENVLPFSDPADAAYSPASKDLPVYSYRTVITRKEDADEPLVLIGFQLIWQDRRERGLNPLNDGIVPTDNQAFGEVLGDLNISHGYFHHQTGFEVPLASFMKAHWEFLTKGTKPLIF